MVFLEKGLWSRLGGSQDARDNQKIAQGNPNLKNGCAVWTDTHSYFKDNNKPPLSNLSSYFSFSAHNEIVN